MSSSHHSGPHGALRDGATSPQRVQAYFSEEVAAQEAMGLLAFHGFRTDGIVLRGVSGASWRRLRPVAHRRQASPFMTRSVLMGGMVGMVVGAFGLALAGRLMLGALSVLVVLAAGIAGGLTGQAASRGASARPSATTEHAEDLLTPAGGCVVSVQTLRTDEARSVLERADGVLVVPADQHECDPPVQG